MCGSVEKILHQRSNFGNSRRAANQHDFIDLLRLQSCVFQRLLARADGAIDNWLNQLLELFAGDLALVALAFRQLNIELD